MLTSPQRRSVSCKNQPDPNDPDKYEQTEAGYHSKSATVASIEPRLATIWQQGHVAGCASGRDYGQSPPLGARIKRASVPGKISRCGGSKHKNRPAAPMPRPSANPHKQLINNDKNLRERHRPAWLIRQQIDEICVNLS
jgi:hypothetical protein